MGLESATYISQLVATNPASGDPKSQGDDHLRLLKSVLQAQFPNLGAAAVTVLASELNALAGVTGAVQTQLNAKAPVVSPALLGSPTAPTASPSDSSTRVATTAYVDSAVAVEAGNRATSEAMKAPLASPSFTGSPTAPTPAQGDNSSLIATTAFVAGVAFSSSLPGVTGIPDGYVVGRQGGATAWIQGPSLRRSVRNANTTLAQSDQGWLIDFASGTFTQTIAAAAALGAGWYVWVRNSGTGVVIFDPNGAETIGGTTTATLNPGDIWLVTSDGSGLQILRMQGANRQTLLSSGTFTVPAGVYRIFAEVWGAGGGSGGVANSAGGGGGYAAAWLSVSPGQSISASIGTGTAGGNGGSTTFGPLTANGGIAGASGPGGGGSASGGDVNTPGGLGGAAGAMCIGGTSYLGSLPAIASTTGVVAGITPGGGSVTNNSGGAGAGGNGQVVVKWV